MKKPPLSPDEREMLDRTRQLQEGIGTDPSAKGFWEDLKYVENIDIPEEN
jgi:hypothetical protein